MNYKADKAGQQEGRRRIKFLVKLGLFILILVVNFKYPHLLEDLGIPKYVVGAVIFYVTTHIIVSFIRLSLVTIYLRRHHQEAGFRDNFIIGINQIANILSYFALGIAFMLLFNIKPQDFFTSISIIAAAIAILFKDYITNMINGLILMFSNQIAIDDSIKIGEHVGKIVDITLVNVHMLSEDDDLIFIPNSTILNGNIVNLTKNNQKKIILEFTLQSNQIEGLNELERYLIESLEQYEEHIKRDSQQMRVVSINSNNVSIKFQLVLYKQNRRMEREIRRHLNWNIIHFINESNREEKDKKLEKENY